MDQVATFFDMGGYGLFVWPCFAISALALLALYFSSRRRLMIVERELALIEGHRRKRGERKATVSSGKSLP